MPQKKSIVILDELGRGTSTFDGYAIAFAVLKQLTTMNCRVLFSTHYHKLTDEFASDPTIQLGHLACREEGQKMVFLYKMKEGPCPKSYGMNVARMANLPGQIVDHASVMALRFEEMMAKQNRKHKVAKQNYFKQLFSSQNPVFILEVWKQLQHVDFK